MKIFVGADHNGFDYKNQLKQTLEMAGHEVVDVSGDKLNREDDFPQFASSLVNELLGDKEAKGILICGSGQGMCMTANRFKGIRAALCWNLDEARSSRNDDDANVLCLSSKYTTFDDAKAIMSAFLSTPFAGAPRFMRRIEQMDQVG